MTLSDKALTLLKELFSDTSNLQLPAGLASEVVEIRRAVNDELLSNKNDALDPTITT